MHDFWGVSFWRVVCHSFHQKPVFQIGQGSGTGKTLETLRELFWELLALEFVATSLGIGTRFESVFSQKSPFSSNVIRYTFVGLSFAGSQVIGQAPTPAPVAPLPSASQLTLPTTATAKAEFFFRDPNKFQSGPSGFISSLYLLRNDMKTMNRIAPVELIWFKAMGVMTGIDMVSKLSSTGDQKARFEHYIKTYLISKNASTANADKWSTALYYLRNSLEHSFALQHESGSGATHYKFKVTYNNKAPLVSTYAVATRTTASGGTITTHTHKVNIKQLEKAFEASVKRYAKAIKTGAPFATHVFDKHGAIKI